MALFAIRVPSGRFSQIFHSREDLEMFVLQQGIAVGEVGVVSFTPLVTIRSQIEIPWEEGFGSLESRLEQSGVREEEQEASSTSMRIESEPEAGDPPANKKPVKRRSRASLPRNGKTSS